MKYPIQFVENPTESDHLSLVNGINEYAETLGLKPTAGSYFFAVRDETDSIVAAISGFDNFGPAEIGGLWVKSDLRGQGYGKALVEKAEKWAKAHGCSCVTVFTLKEWPVFEWYKILGFTVEFERPGHHNATSGCYLIKKL